MNTLTLQTLRSRGAKAIPDDHVVYLIVNSRPKSVLVPPEEYDMLVEALEELEDIKAIEARRGEKLMSWDEVFSKRRK